MSAPQARPKPHIVITDDDVFVYEAILEREGIAVPTSDVYRSDESAKIDWKRFGDIYVLEPLRSTTREDIYVSVHKAQATSRLTRIWA